MENEMTVKKLAKLKGEILQLYLVYTTYSRGFLPHVQFMKQLENYLTQWQHDLKDIKTSPEEIHNENLDYKSLLQHFMEGQKYD